MSQIQGTPKMTERAYNGTQTKEDEDETPKLTH